LNYFLPFFCQVGFEENLVVPHRTTTIGKKNLELLKSPSFSHTLCMHLCTSKTFNLNTKSLEKINVYLDKDNEIQCSFFRNGDIVTFHFLDMQRILQLLSKVSEDIQPGTIDWYSESCSNIYTEDNVIPVSYMYNKLKNIPLSICYKQAVHKKFESYLKSKPKWLYFSLPDVNRIVDLKNSKAYKTHLDTLLYCRPRIILVNIAIASHLLSKGIVNFYQMEDHLNFEIIRNLESFLNRITELCTSILSKNLYSKLTTKLYTNYKFDYLGIQDSLIINYTLLTQRTQMFAMFIKNNIFLMCKNDACLNPICEGSDCIPEY
jgi:hypothetical protein